MNNQLITKEEKIDKSLFIIIISYIYLIIFVGVVLPVAILKFKFLFNGLGLIYLLVFSPSFIIIYTKNKFLYKLMSFILIIETSIVSLAIILLSGAKW